MSDRFYQQQLAATGSCPGYNGKRKRRMAWTPEKREEVIAAYQEAEPTAETSMEVVEQLAEEHGESINGVRQILSKAGVYVKKTAATSAKASGGTTGGRVSKADSQASLISAIQDAGQEADEEIIGRMTGKAAVYFAEVIAAITK